MFMKSQCLSAILLAGFLTFSISSCTSEDQPASVEGQTAQVSFAIMMPEGLQSKAVTAENPLGDTPWKSYTQCMSQFDKDGKPIPSNPDFPIVANMNITRSEDGTGSANLDIKVNIIKRTNGSYVTDPITVDAGKTYTINSITITDDTNLSQVYFSGVTSGALFAPYVSQTLPQTFTVAAFTKPIIDVWVLCARGFEDVNKPEDLVAKGWSGFTGSESIVPGGIPSSGKYMLAAGTNNIGQDKYTWTTGKFQYVTGDKISMDLNAFIKFDDWDNSNTKADDKDPGHDGGYVTVKVSNSSIWLQDKPVLVSEKSIPSGCYKMILETTLPGFGWAIDPKTGEAKHWYDVFNFGIDNIQNNQ